VQDSLKTGSTQTPLRTRVETLPGDEAGSLKPPADKLSETEDEQPPQKSAGGGASQDPSEPEPADPSKSHKVQSRVLGPGEPLEVAVGLLNNEKLLRLTPGKGQTESFSDCPSCPEMVLIPSGQGIMGSRPESDGYRSEEAPPHRIRVDKPFAVSKEAISASNWRACVDAGVCRLTLSSLLAVGPRVAATRISWFDARSYVEWLTQTTGWRYRLLSEAEWEYVAKATVRKEADASRNRTVSDAAKETPQVFPRVRFDYFSGAGLNAWGIQRGSVLEWVEDCWHTNYELAPADGASWLSAAGGDCAYRVVRGAAKSGGAFGSRPTARAREFADTNSPTLGFRVAREILAPEEN
jgi:formylglycine-generating enzyme required for sulfatase activity